MRNCINCGKTNLQIEVYICDRCPNYICDDCYKYAHSYDRQVYEVLCPKCHQDIRNQLHEETDYIYSSMISYIPTE
jgi:hypothetical protein